MSFILHVFYFPYVNDQLYPSKNINVCFFDFSVNVDEITKNISLSVVRTQGTFGNVSVFYYAQSIVEGTTQGQDFTITPQVERERESIYIYIQGLKGFLICASCIFICIKNDIFFT